MDAADRGPESGKVRAESSGRHSVDVTVVIPIHNKARYLRECLASVLDQAGVTLEVICIDDCSTDGSASIVDTVAASNPQVRACRNASQRGAAQSRNLGIELARGRYVQFTDADDLLVPGALRTLHNATERTGAQVVRGTFQGLKDGVTFSWPTERVTSERSGRLLDLPELWIPWFHFCYLISRDLLARNELRYPSLVAGEDPVFMARVLTAAERVHTIPELTYLYRQDDPRSGPSLQTVEDYVSHAEMVRAIYAGRHAACWAVYRPFIQGDIRLLLDQSSVSEAEYEVLERKIASL